MYRQIRNLAIGAVKGFEAESAGPFRRSGVDVEHVFWKARFIDGHVVKGSTNCTRVI